MRKYLKTRGYGVVSDVHLFSDGRLRRRPDMSKPQRWQGESWRTELREVEDARRAAFVSTRAWLDELADVITREAVFELFHTSLVGESWPCLRAALSDLPLREVARIGRLRLGRARPFLSRSVDPSAPAATVSCFECSALRLDDETCPSCGAAG